MTRNRNRAKERASQAARIARERIAASRDLAPGERLIQYYCCDCAECDCAPESAYNGIDTMRVGRADGVDRCLRCGATWPEKRWRDDGRTARGTRAGWLDDYLRDEEQPHAA